MRAISVALLLAIATEGAYAADTVGQFRARDAARELLEAMEAAPRRLEAATLIDYDYRTIFREPLERAIDRFDRTTGTTAADRAPFQSCAAGARLLLDIGAHIVRGADADWRLDSLRRYKDLLRSCRLSVNR